MVDVRELVNDLNDAVVEYQVGVHVGKCTSGYRLMYPVVLTAKGDLRSKLYIDCKFPCSVLREYGR